MRKLLVLFFAFMLAAPAAFAADPDPFDEGTVKEKPAAKKKKKGREVEAKASLEAPEPELAGMLSQKQLLELSEIMAQTTITEARLKLEQLEARRLENQKKMNEVLMPPPAMTAPEPEPAPISRVFPMPGGNPQVTAIIGGSRKALEATLKFPNGVIYEVTKGMMLEGGYVVVEVSGKGVVLEKNGLRLSMPVSQGEMKGKPWDSGEEQGQQVAGSTTPPPPPAQPGDEGNGRRRRR